MTSRFVQIIAAALLLITFLCCLCNLQAQEIDSLVQKLSTVTTTKDSINIHYRLAWLMANNNNGQALLHSHQGLNKSRKLNDDRLISIGLSRVGIMHRVGGQYDSAIHYLSEALPYAQKIENPLFPTGMLFNLGVVYSYKGEYEKSLGYYYKCMEINNANDYELGNADCLNSIAIVNRKLGKDTEALEKYNEALTLFEKANRKWDQANVKNNIGNLMSDRGDFEQAMKYYMEAREINLEVGDQWGMCMNHIAIGDLNIRNKQFPKALINFQRANFLADSLNLPKEQTEALESIGHVYLELGETQKAEPILLKSVTQAQELQLLEVEAKARKHLALLYENQGRFNEAYYELESYTSLNDSLRSSEQIETINELEIRFETVKKDQQIAEQNLDIERGKLIVQQEKSNRNKALFGGGLAFLLLIGVSINFRQKKRLNQQRLATLEKEKQLASVQSFIDGEEKERMRIAKDLHDGLNGLLAGTKLQFASLTDDIADKNKEKYLLAIKSLDNASGEVRRISHNMMPQELLRFGLIEALQSYFNSINTSGRLQIEFQHYGMENRIVQSIELVIYRIILELINNIIKHAKASEALVQLNRNEEVLSITVEDDGIGFDASTGEFKSGIGMQNLQSRVDFLDGELNIQSSQERGTFVYIEVQLNKR